MRHYHILPEHTVQMIRLMFLPHGSTCFIHHPFITQSLWKDSDGVSPFAFLGLVCLYFSVQFCVFGFSFSCILSFVRACPPQLLSPHPNSFPLSFFLLAGLSLGSYFTQLHLQAFIFKFLLSSLLICM